MQAALPKLGRAFTFPASKTAGAAAACMNRILPAHNETGSHFSTDLKGGVKMLDQRTIEIVKSTAPVLKQNSEAIGKRFYQLLFGNHPELSNLFNQTNQKRGIQQKSLAHSVYVSGEHIDQLESIQPIPHELPISIGRSESYRNSTPS